MDKDTRNRIQRTTQAARRLLEEELAEQLEGVYDIRLDGTVAPEPGRHLAEDPEALRVRAKLVEAVAHHRAQGRGPADAVAALRRECAFTTLNRFVALKMLEARGLVQACVSQGQQSAGFNEFLGLAEGLKVQPDAAYRLYLECLFDEVGREVRVLFDRRDAASLLWPRRTALEGLLKLLNDAELAPVWAEDETIGWVYQYFNGEDERRQMRAESQAPRNSRELAVRNQFFTPRYVVEFLTDNTLGRTWVEMRQGETALVERCRYLVRRAKEVFLREGEVEPADAAPQREGKPGPGPGPGPGVAEMDRDGGVQSAAGTRSPAASLRPEREGGPGGPDRTGPGPGPGPGPQRPGDRAAAEEPHTPAEVLHREAQPAAAHAAPHRDDPGPGPGPGPRVAEMNRDGSVQSAAGTRSPAGALHPERVSAGGPDGTGPGPGPGPGPGSQRPGDRAAAEEPRPVYVPFRAKKDPRDVRVLDPACGSGHFLLYAFDLLQVIYEEAWADEAAPASEATGATLRADHPTLDALRRALPGLVLRHNLHGVDIDPRAAQIAALALWMRAQRAWNDYGVKRADRPLVTRTHVVVAEPMPGEQDLLDEFCDRLEPRVAALVRTVFAEMALAGEAGTLLRIEDTVRQALRTQTAHAPAQRVWGEVERQVFEALRVYAESVGGQGYRRRLFAEDAAQGFAFVEVCRQRYDVVLMNPPFGAGSLKAKAWLGKAWPRTKHDLYAAFVERGVGLVPAAGFVGAITSRTGFFLKSFQRWREEVILGEAPPTVFADLGAGVLDSAMVETAAYCLRRAG